MADLTYTIEHETWYWDKIRAAYPGADKLITVTTDSANGESFAIEWKRVRSGFRDYLAIRVTLYGNGLRIPFEFSDLWTALARKSDGYSREEVPVDDVVAILEAEGFTDETARAVPDLASAEA